MKWRPTGLIVVVLLVLGIAGCLPFDTEEEGCAEQQKPFVALPVWQELRAQSQIVEYRELLRKNEQPAGQCLYFIYAMIVQVIENGERSHDYVVNVDILRDDKGPLLLVGTGESALEECQPFQFIGVAEGLVEWTEPSSGQRIDIPRLKTIAVRPGKCYSHSH